MVPKSCPPLPPLLGLFLFKVSDPNLLLEPPRLLVFQFLWEKSVKESRCYVQKILTEICKQYFDMQRDLSPQPLRKQTLIHLAKWLSVCLRTKWLRFESRCCHSNFRYRACFEKGVP